MCFRKKLSLALLVVVYAQGAEQKPVQSIGSKVPAAQNILAPQLSVEEKRAQFLAGSGGVGNKKHIDLQALRKK